MTAAQRAELKAQLEAEERAEKQKREEDIEAYKSSVDETCRTWYERLKQLSERMRREKELIFAEAETLIGLKDDLFKTKTDRRSDQFTTSDGRITISLGSRTVAAFDDTVNAGISKIHEFLKSLTREDEDAQLTYDLVVKLLARDRKGNLNPSRIIELAQIADRHPNDTFREGVKIIQAAYRSENSSRFVSAAWKDHNGVKHTLPLTMAAME